MTTEKGKTMSTTEGAWPEAGDGCTCWVSPNPFTHYGAVEPGDALEPNPDCPVHFPREDVTTPTNSQYIVPCSCCGLVMVVADDPTNLGMEICGTCGMRMGIESVTTPTEADREAFAKELVTGEAWHGIRTMDVWPIVDAAFSYFSRHPQPETVTEVQVEAAANAICGALGLRICTNYHVHEGHKRIARAALEAAAAVTPGEA